MKREEKKGPDYQKYLHRYLPEKEPNNQNN